METDLLDMIELPRPKLSEETKRSLEISTGKSFEQLVSEPFRVPIPNRDAIHKPKNGNEVVRMFCGFREKVRRLLARY